MKFLIDECLSSTGKNGNRKGPRRNKPHRLDENGRPEGLGAQTEHSRRRLDVCHEELGRFPGTKHKPGTKGQYPEAVQQSLTSR